MACCRSTNAVFHHSPNWTRVNTPRPSDWSMGHWIGSLVQLMARRLFGTGHCPIQCWLILNWIHGNILECNLIQNTFSIDEKCCISRANELTLWGRVTHICVGKLTNIGSDNGLSPAWSAPSHYLNQCCNIVNWTLSNKLQWNYDRNSTI